METEATNKQGHADKSPNSAGDDILRPSNNDIPKRCELLDGMQDICKPRAKTSPAADLVGRLAVYLGRESHHLLGVWGGFVGL